MNYIKSKYAFQWLVNCPTVEKFAFSFLEEQEKICMCLRQHTAMS